MPQDFEMAGVLPGGEHLFTEANLGADQVFL
jgi:hypothetical protein